jgi:hypothetical protein
MLVQSHVKVVLAVLSTVEVVLVVLSHVEVLVVNETNVGVSCWLSQVLQVVQTSNDSSQTKIDNNYKAS